MRILRSAFCLFLLTTSCTASQRIQHNVDLQVDEPVAIDAAILNKDGAEQNSFDVPPETPIHAVGASVRAVISSERPLRAVMIGLMNGDGHRKMAKIEGKTYSLSIDAIPGLDKLFLKNDRPILLEVIAVDVDGNTAVTGPLALVTRPSH